MNQSKIEWFLLSFMLLIVAVVFWQIYTVMVPAGIASGGPYDNAASYPRVLAVILGLLTALRLSVKIVQNEGRAPSGGTFSFSSIRFPVLLLSIFGIYLMGLGFLGYHLMTAPFLVAVLFLTGERKWFQMLVFGVLSSLAVAFVFEVLLKIVLPGGIFRINIPW
jgi:hypothetical protein